MKREDVLNVDALKDEISTGFQQVNDALRQFNRTLSRAFGQVVYALDTVIERHNVLEQRLDTISEQLVEQGKELRALRDRMNGHDK